MEENKTEMLESENKAEFVEQNKEDEPKEVRVASKDDQRRGVRSSLIVALIFTLILGGITIYLRREPTVIQTEQVYFRDMEISPEIAGKVIATVPIEYTGLEVGETYNAVAEVVEMNGTILTFHGLTFTNSIEFTAEAESGMIEVGIPIDVNEYDAHGLLFNLSFVRRAITE